MQTLGKHMNSKLSSRSNLGEPGAVRLQHYQAALEYKYLK